MIKPADRLGEVKEYYFSKKLKEIERMRQEGKDVINLGIGNPDLPPSSPTLLSLFESAIDKGNHGYQSYVGIPELRKSFARWYNNFFDVELNPENEILPLMGSKEGIMHISMAYVNAGDEVLVPNPGYPTYQSVSRLVQAKIRLYDLSATNNWQPDFESLEKTDLSKVKIMWINYPHMPTGAKATTELFEKAVEFAKKHNILIVNDNPYSFILNDSPLSILSVKGAKGVALELNSLSKSHNMAGWRIGMLAGKAETISNVLRVKSNMDSGMFRPLQVAAAKALKSDDDWYKNLNKIYKERQKIVFEIMDVLRCQYDKNQSGMFVWAKMPDTYENTAALSDKVLKNAHVFITPGFIFGTNGEGFIRISLCNTNETLNEAKNRIQKLKI